MDYVYGPGRNHLFVPGPVNIPDPVIRAMNRNNEDYRSPAIPALTKTLLEDVKKIFKTTTGIPFLIPTTGTFTHGQAKLYNQILSVFHDCFLLILCFGGYKYNNYVLKYFLVKEYNSFHLEENLR